MRWVLAELSVGESVPEFAEIEVPLNVREIIDIMTALSVMIYFTRMSHAQYESIVELAEKLVALGKHLPEEDKATMAQELEMERLFHYGGDGQG
jgi:hypothetical protein